MDGLRVAPLLGILGCVGVLCALAYPYAVSDVGVGAYYASGPVTPLATGVFAAVGIIVFAAGREGRTDPSFAAGAGLVFGVFIVAILLAWGMTARVDAVEVSQYHRWATVAVGLLVPVGGLWFAHALDVV